MPSYFDYVNGLFHSNSTETIANDSADNAADLYRAIFSHATESVRIACTNFSKSVFDRPCVAAALREALQQGVKVFIASTETMDISRSTDVLKEFPKQVSLFQGGTFRSKGHLVNFCVMDYKGYRYEPDIRQPKAIACANDQDFAGKLRRAFDDALMPISAV